MAATTLEAMEVVEAGTPADLKKAQQTVRAHLRKEVGTILLAMMGLGRYRHHSIADLQHLLIDPLVRNRIAIAYPSDERRGAPSDITGFAIWASVSEEVDAKIREQIRAKSFPIRLKPEDWISGEINWLFDIVAPDQKAASAILRNLRKVIDGKAFQMHPIVPKLLDEDTAKQVVEQKVDQ